MTLFTAVLYACHSACHFRFFIAGAASVAAAFFVFFLQLTDDSLHWGNNCKWTWAFMAFLLLWPHLATVLDILHVFGPQKESDRMAEKHREEIWPVIVCFPFGVSAKRFFVVPFPSSVQLAVCKKPFPNIHL